MVVMLRIAFLLLVLKVSYEDAVTYSMTIMEMIRSYGYPVQEHQQIVTDDGYLLTMYRIPYGITNKARGNRPVVFLMHGLLSSAYDFVNMGPGFSITYDLVEAGFDVWIGNARGNKFSRKHVDLHPILNRKKFWSFSWHEIGVYDLPAMIDFVLMMTDQEKLSFIGHSQGTTSFFVMASTRPNYNNKITLMVALGPIVYMDGMWNPLMKLMAKVHGPIKFILNILGWHEFVPGDDLINLIGRKACSSLSPIKAVCASVFFMVCGWDSQQLNRSSIPMILSNVPAGASTRQFVHYAQVMNSRRFQQYDFGRKQNLEIYRSEEPPRYKLSKVSAPILLFHAENDWLASLRDLERLRDELSNVEIYTVPYKKFNHLDYLFAMDVKKLVNNRIVHSLRKFNQ